MIVEAALMYKALVRVFGTYTKNVLLKYSVIGWVVPIIFPLIGLAWGAITGVDFANPKTFAYFIHLIFIHCFSFDKT